VCWTGHVCLTCSRFRLSCLDRAAVLGARDPQHSGQLQFAVWQGCIGNLAKDPDARGHADTSVSLLDEHSILLRVPGRAVRQSCYFDILFIPLSSAAAMLYYHLVPSYYAVASCLSGSQMVYFHNFSSSSQRGLPNHLNAPVISARVQLHAIIRDLG